MDMVFDNFSVLPITLIQVVVQTDLEGEMNLQYPALLNIIYLICVHSVRF